MLRIYGTVYNNADLIEKCLRSISGLKPYHIYVVDNFSTDKTYNILKKHKAVSIKRLKCSRGKGRDVALAMMLKKAAPDDPVMYLDFDTIFSPEYVSMLLKKIRTIKPNEMYNLFNGLSLASTNANLPWRNLNAAEDWERLARAKSMGIHLLQDRTEMFKFRSFVNNREALGYLARDRERRYASGWLSLNMRLLRMLVDNERGRAHKSFGEFYEISSKKSVKSCLLFLAAYLCARIIGIYSYDPKKSNKEYVLGFKVSTLWKF
ncbi:MAG: glycosyltransferase family 2 protein [Candidatus Micrarchaeaceae archaeon]